MKKMLKSIFIICTFVILPALFLFTGCFGGNDDNKFVSNMYIESVAGHSVTNGELNLVYGNVYDFDKSQIKVYVEYTDGSKKQLKDSEFSYSTTLPSGVVADRGVYSIDLGYDFGQNYYSANVWVCVNAVIDKPTCSVTEFIYDGVTSKPEITGFNSEFMYECLYSYSVDVSYYDNYFIEYYLNEYCMWSDGTTDPYRLEWKILPYVLPDPVFNTNAVYDIENGGYSASVSDILNFNDYVEIEIFDTEWIDFGDDWLSAGTHELTCSIDNYNFVFESTMKSTKKVNFVVKAVEYEFPTIEYVRTYNHGNVIYLFNDEYREEIVNDYFYGWFAYIGNSEVGEYECDLDFGYHSGSVVWKNIPEHENITKINDSSVKVSWKIVPMKLERPTLVAGSNHYVFDLSTHYPVFELSNGESIDDMAGYWITNYDGDYDYGKVGAGNYTTKVSLANDSSDGKINYTWEDGGTESLYFDWVIEKARLDDYMIQTPGRVYAKNTFTMNDIFLPFDFDFSEYSSDEELPIYNGEPIAWTFNGTENITGGTHTKYSFVDDNDIIWEKSVYDYSDNTKDMTKITQKLDLSNKSIGEIQYYYATYDYFDENYYDEKSLLSEIHIANKGSQFVTYHIFPEMGNNLVYGDVFKIDDYEVKSSQNYKVVYRFHNDDTGENFIYGHNDVLPNLVDAGDNYTIYIGIEESEDYSYYEHFVNYNISIKKMQIQASHLDGRIEASKAYYLEDLDNCVLSGTALVKGREVEGTFEWENPVIEPTLNDSMTTLYSFRFTPNDTDNYIGTGSAITVFVDRARAKQYTFPKIGTYEGGSTVVEGDRYDSLFITQTSAYVYDYKGRTIKGNWSIIYPENETFVGTDMRLMFTPENQEKYQGFVVESIFGKCESLFRVNDIVLENEYKPDFIIHKNGEFNAHNGKVHVYYTNNIYTEDITRVFDINSDLLTFTNVSLEGAQKFSISYLGYTSSKNYDYTECIVVSTAEDFVSYVKSPTAEMATQLVLVDGDIVVEDPMGDITRIPNPGRVIVPSWSSLKINEIYLTRDYTGGNSIFDAQTKSDVHDLSSSFYNFGELEFGLVCGNLELVNYGETIINKSWIEYFALYNQAGRVDILECYESDVEYLGHTPTYTFNGFFENYAEFNFLYFDDYVIDVDEESYGKDVLFRFLVLKESINAGSLVGRFEFSEGVNLKMYTGSKIDKLKFFPMIRKVVDGEVLATRTPIVETISMDYYANNVNITYNVETLDDFILALELMSACAYDGNYQYASRHISFTVNIKGNIDLTGHEDLFTNGDFQSNTRARVFIPKLCKINVWDEYTLNLSSLIMTIVWAEDDADKGHLNNYGTVIGTVVCEYNKNSTSTESYSKYDYITGDIDGTIYKYSEYKEIKDQLNS